MRTTRRHFTQVEDVFIRANYGAMPVGDIASSLGRLDHSIEQRASKLGVTRKLKRWTPEEDEVIRAGIGRELRTVADQLGRRKSEVSQRARSLGIEWRKRNGYRPSSGRPVSAYRSTEVSNGKRVRIMEHRDIMEKHLGRSLSGVEVVHHINLNQRDNGIGNLHLCANRSAHRKAHASLERLCQDMHLVPALLECGHITFDRASGIYRLCEIHK